MADKKKKQQQVEEPPKAPFDPTKMVRLVAKDGHEFVILRDCALVSKTVKKMLNPPGAPPEEYKNVAHFPKIDSVILEKVIQYFHYKHRYETDPDNRPAFTVPPEMALDLMLVAHYLET